MSRLIDRETTNMKATNAKIMQQLIDEEKCAQKELSCLLTQYEKCHRDLEMCFNISKNKILQKMQEVRQRNEKILLLVDQQIKNYSTSAALKPFNRQLFKTEEVLLFEHAVCSAIASQRKFDEKQWLLTSNEVVKVSTKERKKLQRLEELLQTFMSS